MIAIQGTYTKVTTVSIPDVYIINPFDLYGNLLSEMTIEVDSTLSQPFIILPLISDLNNNWNIKINVIALTGLLNPVGIAVPLPNINKIGSENVVNLITNGANIEISPVGNSSWAANLTA